MANKAYENQKRALNYSKTRVEKAGRDIRHGCDGEVRRESIEIIQNFREVHLYPLMLIKNHLTRSAKKVTKKALVVRRLKRLPTIIDKLERPTLDGQSTNAISLSRMQDIGGCRAILANIQQVKNFIQFYGKVNRYIKLSGQMIT
ncbi:MAG: ppGpp synthetase/RelA/SpoT-type nucleotidyltransferase [Oceanospirillaceae bacterium]|jgi:ppGpp synthetase/RelA/SpoT-type nucleotidyltranferase